MQKYLANKIPHTFYPGDEEMYALMRGALGVLQGREKPKKYK